MTTTFTNVASAYITGETLDITIIPGLEGSGAAPVATGTVVDGNADAALSELGWQILDVTPVGVLRQSGPWTDAGDFRVATVVPADADTRCPVCGRRDHWVIDFDGDIVCVDEIDI